MTKNSGITLVALIITIIVMLILVAVTVTIVINGGIIPTAREAAAAYKTAKTNEEQMGTNIIIKEGDEEVEYASPYDYAYQLNGVYADGQKIINGDIDEFFTAQRTYLISWNQDGVKPTNSDFRIYIDKTSENSADICLKLGNIKIYTNVSLETDLYTGDIRKVVGEADTYYATGGAFTGDLTYMGENYSKTELESRLKEIFRSLDVETTKWLIDHSGDGLYANGEIVASVEPNGIDAYFDEVKGYIINMALGTTPTSSSFSVRFDKTSESSADVVLNVENKFSVATSVSLTTDAETGDPRTVIGDAILMNATNATVRYMGLPYGSTFASQFKGTLEEISVGAMNTIISNATP